MNQPTRFRQPSRRGFSLIELLVVSTVMIMLTGVVVVAYSYSSRVSRDKRRESDIAMVKLALEQYYEIHEEYPVADSMEDLLNDSEFTDFLQAGRVKDPLNTPPYVYSVTSNIDGYELSYTKESNQQEVVVRPLGFN
jgi:prepilin-type N-terminal cleavage/methylation domain-containing protein